MGAEGQRWQLDCSQDFVVLVDNEPFIAGDITFVAVAAVAMAGAVNAHQGATVVEGVADVVNWRNKNLKFSGSIEAAFESGCFARALRQVAKPYDVALSVAWLEIKLGSTEMRHP